ncbi:DUF5996 family protein [Pseudonocardia endophytica]|uniref:Ava_C0101 and related proteins n=1 Tax=Pseudonocardia endophytica TaxID=401976 RepID=A0A4R1HPQ9_PSEEN|nr:DUF5996 family protein [Pseudonocardia endophytica]TCK24544.1 hypothetical protein EV378_0318 [Pseudonocardia endophytica]
MTETTPFPDLPYDSWTPTRETLHRFAQIVGKVRLAASHRRNHWWNVPLHLTGRGLTTRPMSAGDGRIFTIDLDLLDHRLDLTTADGPRWSFPLVGLSVAGFFTSLTDGIEALGLDVRIDRPYPFDLPDAGRPFAEDTEHATYDAEAVTRYWRLLGQVNLLLEEFAARYSGKTSPVHHFWHTFDLAVTRFGDRTVDFTAATDPVTREAYSQEVISFGFWFGDPDTQEPAFYSYTAPEPDGLADDPLTPAGASWVPARGAHLAVLRLSDARATGDVRAAALDFYESAYRAGATRAGWDVDRLDCGAGRTDPLGEGGTR